MTPTLFTSHWRNPSLAEVDAVMVAISRGKPRQKLAFRYRVFKELAPDNRTWAQEDQDAFEAAYLDQLDALGAQAILWRLEGIGGGRPIVLLCWEKLVDPGEWCHRQILAKWIRHRANVEATELVPGDLPQRPDALETRLFD